jgi:hypothetical protein
MHYIVTFETAQFALAAEKPNPINPIHGISVGEWLLARLPEAVIPSGKIEAEDWGWAVDVTYAKFSYMFGFIALPDEQESEPAEVIIIVDKQRSLIEKLLGKNKFDTKDELLAIIKNLIAVDFSDTKIQIQKQG